MKHSALFKSGRNVLMGLTVALIPVTATLADEYYDKLRPDRFQGQVLPPADTMSTGSAPTSRTENESARSEGQWTSNQAGAQGPMRSDTMRSDNMRSDSSSYGQMTGSRFYANKDALRATDKNVESLPNFQRRLSEIFHSD